MYAIEEGIVISQLPFTGIDAESPWWRDTQCVMIKGKSGTILYGEIIPVKLTDSVLEGDLIGYVERVLKKDKGVVESTAMLHMELYNNATEPVWWRLDEDKPSNLLDVTQLLNTIK